MFNIYMCSCGTAYSGEVNLLFLFFLAWVNHLKYHKIENID